MSKLHHLAFVLVPLLVASACLESEDDPDLDDTEQAARVSYKGSVKNRQLSITGTSAASSVTLRVGATGRLEVDVGSDGTAELQFDRATFERILVDAGGGDDVIRMDELVAAFTLEEAVTIRGGAGNDTIIGGIGPEHIQGGTGHDAVFPGRGTDTVDLGDGDDTVTWNPGDSSDVIEGGGGLDRLMFHGASVGETIGFAVADDHLRLSRDVGAVVVDSHGLELVDLHARGGADRITIDDLTAAAIARIDIDLSDIDPAQGDGLADLVVLNGTAGADHLSVSLDGGAVLASGLATEVRVRNGEPAHDRLVIDGGGGDRIDIDGTDGPDVMNIVSDGTGRVYDGGGFSVLVAPAPAIAVTVNGNDGDDQIVTNVSDAAPVAIDGGAGNDTIVGGPGPDLLRGGPGADIIDGRYAADTVLLGDGDDTFVWNPGGGNDVVEGEGGSDTLAFSGANIDELLDVRGVDGRVRVLRNVAVIALDLGSVERIDLTSRGGSDVVTVGPLHATGVSQVNVDLAMYGDGTGDALADHVVIDGVAGDVIDVATDGDAVAATGLGALVRVRRGEPAIDRLVVRGGRLQINGTAAADTLTVIRDGTSSVYDGGGWNVLATAPEVVDVRVLGHGGDDTITTVGSVTTPLHLDGGDGNDTITGGYAADVLIGGPDDDVVQGRPGSDQVILGDGNDTFVWNPGDASDVIDGDAGSDTLVFNAANVGEVLELRASAGRALVLRNVGTVTTDTGGIERIMVPARGGNDLIQVGDLTGTAVTQVDLDLGSVGAPDGLQDVVTVIGSPSNDNIAVGADSGAVVVTGLPALVRITLADAFDRLDVLGAGGLDAISVAPAAAALMTITAAD
ncbi:MAG: hypothetical protein K8M05_03000 [Deltaproteobacteria bacterium]|nr:hypothetical protein [Kofleriaceae bacterium]